jgi:hypothetical protein
LYVFFCFFLFGNSLVSPYSSAPSAYSPECPEHQYSTPEYPARP